MIRDFHGYKCEIDMDVLIISAVLHDVSRVLECECDETSGYRISAIGRTYQHGFYGAYWAEAEGLPASIVTAIITHTPSSRVAPNSVEGTILFFADAIDSEMYKYLHGKSPGIMKAIGKM
jgi:hypothetical protein